jgi:hypothetical protein
MWESHITNHKWKEGGLETDSAMAIPWNMKAFSETSSPILHGSPNWFFSLGVTYGTGLCLWRFRKDLGLMLSSGKLEGNLGWQRWRWSRRVGKLYLQHWDIWRIWIGKGDILNLDKALHL